MCFVSNVLFLIIEFLGFVVEVFLCIFMVIGDFLCFEECLVMGKRSLIFLFCIVEIFFFRLCVLIFLCFVILVWGVLCIVGLLLVFDDEGSLFIEMVGLGIIVLRFGF